MSGLGFLQVPCLTINTPLVEPSRMCCAAKPTMEVRNRRFTPLKCAKRTTIIAEVRKDLKRGEMTIQEIPYVDEVVKKMAQNRDAFIRKTESDLAYLEEAYERCRMYFVGRYERISKGLGVFTEDQLQPLMALHAWARRIDDLVDSCEDDSICFAYIDEWEERTKDILNGRPHDILDAALSDTVSKFHVDKMLFEDMIKGMRMDITKKRYVNFEELFLYSYLVSGSIALIILQIQEIAPESTMSYKSINEGPIYLAIALQLTNILNDVSDDAKLGRVYLPQDELAHYGLCDEDIISKNVNHDVWREFMKKQIQRARFYYDLAKQELTSHLDKSSPLPKVWSALILYRIILDEIEENDYNYLTMKVIQ